MTPRRKISRPNLVLLVPSVDPLPLSFSPPWLPPRECVYERNARPDTIASDETFYRWSSILEAARVKPDLRGVLRHLAYTGGWKKFELGWGLIIKTGLLGRMRPLLEGILGS